MKNWTTAELINRIHCWREVYITQVRSVISQHERQKFYEEQYQASLLIIQILEEKKDRGEG